MTPADRRLLLAKIELEKTACADSRLHGREPVPVPEETAGSGPQGRVHALLRELGFVARDFVPGWKAPVLGPCSLRHRKV